MTENVHKRLESMRDLDILSNSGIYTGKDLSSIINKRREFEYKINGPRKNLNDFKEYIAFEMNLQKLITTKSEVLSKNNFQDLNHKLLSKIKSLFEIALIRFPNDEETYLLFFQFCKRTYFKESTKICEKMLKQNPKNEKMWCLAADWYARDRKEYNFALKLLQQGISLHKKSKILYKECLRYEVLNYKANESEINREKLLKRLEIYCSDMFEKIDDIEYYIDLISWAKEHDFLKVIEEMIFKFINEKYNSSHKLWHFLVQKETTGIADNQDENEVLNNGIKIFEQGLDKVSPENIPLMWGLLLEHYDDLLSNKIFDKELVLSKLLSLYKEAAEANHLSEENFIKWASLVPEPETQSILELSVTKHSTSLILWKILLRCLIIKNSPDQIQACFDKAIKAVKENREDLYLILENYHVTSTGDDETMEFYEDVLTNSNQTIRDAIKPKYIIYLSENCDIGTCREAYKKLIKEKPCCKQLYKTMCLIEGSQRIFNKEEFENVHKLGCEQFGRDSVDVWLEYAKFHLFNHKDMGYKEKIHDVCNKARSALPDYLYVQFDDEVTVLLNKFEKLLELKCVK